MSRRWSLSNRLALLFAACTAIVSLFAGVLFSRGSEAHFVELDQQLLETQLLGVRRALQDAHGHDPQVRLEEELSRRADLALRIKDADGERWHGSIRIPPQVPERTGLSTLDDADNNYRTLSAPLYPGRPDSAQLTLLLDITHHQHFLQRMQRLIWLTVGLSALATALLGAWAAGGACVPCGAWAPSPVASRPAPSIPVCRKSICPPNWRNWPTASMTCSDASTMRFSGSPRSPPTSPMSCARHCRTC